MQTRSGFVFPSVPLPQSTDPSDVFEIVLSQVSNWPTVFQARALSTQSLDYDEFLAHIRWLMSHLCEDKKSKRLVTMAIMSSLLSVVRERVKFRKLFRKLAEVCVEKMAEVDDQEVTEFLRVFKRSWCIV